MKKSLFICILLIGQLAIAQPAITVYVFSQTSTPGIVPAREMGDESHKPVAKVNYYVYLSVSPWVNINPIMVRIKATWYSVIRTAVVKSPVKADYPAGKILVPKTTNKVIQLQIGEPILQVKKLKPAIPALISKSEVIISYTWKNQPYYTSRKKITVLPQVHGL